MSASERAEVRAFRELETLVRHLGEELAVFRRRAIDAEGKTKDAGAKSAKRAAPSDSDSDLKKRAHQAEQRVRQMLDRVRFLRQQLQSTQSSGGRS
jgi:predicted  nucleic acid-binding Zn-ribbon protein